MTVFGMPVNLVGAAIVGVAAFGWLLWLLRVRGPRDRSVQ